MNIKKYRIRAKLKQQELADKIGVSNNTISRWELGKFAPSDVAVIKKLLKELNCTFEELTK